MGQKSYRKTKEEVFKEEEKLEAAITKNFEKKTSRKED